MRRAGGMAIAVCALGLLAPGAATADPVATVEARGPVSGPLGFAPGELSVAVGDDVAWVNRDLLARHVPAERHGLWAVDGLAPGETAERTFEAGTHEVLCTVHPQMRATVSVPVELEAERRRVRRTPTRRDRRRSRTVAYVVARWSADPEEGQRFDAQRRRPGGRWITLARGSAEATGRFRTTPGATWEIRARLRHAGREGTTSWSPVARVRA